MAVYCVKGHILCIVVGAELQSQKKKAFPYRQQNIVKGNLGIFSPLRLSLSVAMLSDCCSGTKGQGYCTDHGRYRKQD